MDKIGRDVVLLGISHHNGLGLVRSLGINGVNPYGIIIGENSNKSFIRKSKYWKKTWAVEDDKAAVELLQREFGNRTEKIIVIPYADGAAYEVDKNLNKLSKFCVLPSMNDEEGRIAELMNKQSQYSYCKELGIPMLDTVTIDIGQYSGGVLYPVILKPVVSVEGRKLDITICENEDEYMEAVSELSRKGYTRVLAQSYLKNRQEYVLTGAISKNRFSFIVVHNLRQWPLYMGCGSYSEFVKIPKITNYCSEILGKIQQSGYTGLIDIEFFSDEQEQMFLNEINWRCSGKNELSLYTGVFSAYQYYCDILNNSYDKPLKNDKEGFYMNEAADIRHVFAGNISLMHWLRDLIKTNSFAVWYRDDTNPFFARIMYYVMKAPGCLVKGLMGSK